jgi:sarcosine oxidase subunit gamma
MIAKESPLKGMRIGSVDTVAIRDVPGLHSIDLRVAPQSAAQAAIAELLAITFPRPGHASVISISKVTETHVFTLAPDGWLMVGSSDVEKRLEALRLNNDYHFSATNVSGQRTTLEVEGPNARELLAHLWEQDLREKTFPVGAVSQGLMAKAPVILFHIAGSRYRIMVRSSFALHLWKALVDGAEEFLGNGY